LDPKTVQAEVQSPKEKQKIFPNILQKLSPKLISVSTGLTYILFFNSVPLKMMMLMRIKKIINKKILSQSMLTTEFLKQT